MSLTPARDYQAKDRPRVIRMLRSIGYLPTIAGFAVSLPFWGMAMPLDDIHAIRVQTAVYGATGMGRQSGDRP